MNITKSPIKKTITLSLLVLISFGLSADPYISGELIVNKTSTLTNTLDVSDNAAATLIIDMNVNSNGVKFYSEGLFNAINQNTTVDAYLTKAYVKYRIPYQDNYINFQVGKAYYSLGGGLIYNAGNPIYDYNIAFNAATYSLISTNWNAIATLPLEQNDNYSLYLGAVSILPIERVTTGGGFFLNFEIGNKYFDNIELSLFTRDGENILTGGYKGALYFDYGVFANVKLNDLEDFKASVFATKVYDKVTFNIEALYENLNTTTTKTLLITPSLSYQVDDKLNLSLVNTTTLSYDSGLSMSNNLNGILSYSIVQGFTFGASGSTYFNKEMTFILGFSMDFEF